MWPRNHGGLRIRLATILFLISKETVTSHKYSIEVKREVEVKQSMCVIVPCKFTADSREKFLDSKGYWKKGSEIVASTDTSLGTNKNFHAIGDPNNGDCTLKITNARKEDEGTYYFRFEESKHSIIQYNYRDPEVKVHVINIKEVDGYSIQVDQTVTVQKGLCVTIPCTFTADHMKSFTGSRGQWRTICQELVASNNKSIVGTKPNFQLMGNPDNGDCTLMITDPKEQDSGKYHFRFEDGQTNSRKYSYIFNMITIQVTDFIEKPVISDPEILTEGKKITITCTAPRGCPNALITWQNQTGIWTNSANLTFVPSRSHHQTSLTCQMTFPSLKSYTQNEITLSVQYPPSIFITNEMPEMQNHTIANHTTNQELTVQEGSSLALKCSVDSNPGAQVTWIKGERNVLNKGNGNELMLFLINITASEADKYHCLAQNNLGAVNLTINIIVPPGITKYLVIAGIAGGVGIAALLLVVVTVKLLLCSRAKNTEKKTEDRISTDNKYDGQPDPLYGNTEFAINPNEVLLIAQRFLSFRMWPRKDGRLGLQLVTVLFLISKEPVISNNYSIQVNQELKIPPGICGIVPCKFMADGREKFSNSKGYWKKGSEIVASTDKSIGTKKNFDAIGNPNDGDCTLKITNIRREDGGTYYFRFEESENSIQYNYSDTPVKVEVTEMTRVDGYSIQVNQTVTVQKGLCVTIPCTFTADHIKSFNISRGYWKSICREYVASSDKSINGTKPHFQLTGNPNNGDCTLMITGAKEQDSGMYYFRFEDGKVNRRKYSYIFNKITIIVTDPNKNHVISDPGILTEGRRVTLTCTAPGGCPNALITWQDQTGIWTNSTNLTFVPTRSHHKTSLTCQMNFPSLKSYSQNEITLSVHYPPSIFITTATPGLQNHISTNHTTNQELTVQEGSSLALKCLVDSNPRAQVTWMKGERNVRNEGNGSELMLNLSNIIASEADKYHCLAHNNLGAINQTIIIIVQSDYTKYFVMAGAVGIAALLLVAVAVTVKLLLRSRTKNNKTEDSSVKNNQYECQPDHLYGNTEPYTLYANTDFAISVKKEKQSNTKPKNFEEEPVDFEESVYANA